MLVGFSDAPGPLSASTYLLGSLFAGAASACLCIEMQRVYGSIESESILLHGSVSYLVSILMVLVLSVLPNYVQYAVYVLAPLPIALCLLKTRAELTKQELFGRGRDARLKMPYKLLVTSLLHGLSLGLLAGSAIYLQAGGTYLACAMICYVISAVLILFAAFSLRLSFNSLIYQMAFPIISLGLYASFMFDSLPEVGVSVQLVGFSFLHLVMWCVCSFLIKDFDLSATWVVGTSTCAFMVGQLIGDVSSCLVAQVPDSPEPFRRLIVTALLVMLGASLLMMSNRNLRTGWGLAKPDAARRPSRSTLELAMKQAAVEAALTEREADVLFLLGRGRNRQSISDELCISKETAKTHIQSIYRKIGVHSQQELLSLLERKGEHIEVVKDE